MMGNGVLPRERTAQKGPRKSPKQRATQWKIGISISVNADVRRLSQTLTEAEYLETWICLPSHNQSSHAIASRTGNDYQLDLYCGDSLSATIAGSYLVCNQRKMLLSWTRSNTANPAASFVDIRLRGNFGSSTMELEHTGLNSAAEYFWQMAMWRASLEKLVGLMRNSRLAPLSARFGDGSGEVLR
ncbi:MAG: SRPBCC domain-containing protein [Terracidiphilus sp.]